MIEGRRGCKPADFQTASPESRWSSNARVNADELEAAVDVIVDKALKASGVGLSVGIARGDKILLAKGYGLANVEHSVPATKDTVYRIGSITKEFTDAGVLLLAEDGRLRSQDFYLPIR